MKSKLMATLTSACIVVLTSCSDASRFNLDGYDSQSELLQDEQIEILSAEVFANLFPPLPEDFEIEVLLKVNVVSNGCTDADSFATRLTFKDDRQILDIGRIVEDYCRVIPHTIEVELKAAPYALEYPMFFKGEQIAVTENVVH